MFILEGVGFFVARFLRKIGFITVLRSPQEIFRLLRARPTVNRMFGWTLSQRSGRFIIIQKENRPTAGKVVGDYHRQCGKVPLTFLNLKNMVTVSKISYECSKKQL